MSEFLLLGWIFLKIGLFSIGGGYAMLPLINSELVGYGLMTQLEVADIVAVSQMTPGTFAINAATFAGAKTTGLLGGVVATAAVVLPSFIITTLLARYYFKFEDNVIVRRAMRGLKPVVTGLIASAAAIMALPALLGADSVSELHWDTLFSAMDIPSVIIALLSGIAVIKFKRSPILVILIAGIVGLLLFGVIGL